MDKKIHNIKIVKINSTTFQLTKIATSLIAKISDKFSFLPQGYKYQAKFRLMGINGVKIKMVKADGSFPAGLFSEVVQFITEDIGKEVVLSNDVMEHFLPLNDLIKGGIRDDLFSDYYFDDNGKILKKEDTNEHHPEQVILRDYQIGAVESAFENRNCLLNLSTGSGKCLGPNTKLKIKVPKIIAEKYNLKVK